MNSELYIFAITLKGLGMAFIVYCFGYVSGYLTQFLFDETKS